MGSYNTTGVLKGQSGPSAAKAEEASPEIVVSAQALSKLDALQMLLDVIGLIPGFGAPADILNAIISGARGDWLGAGLSLVGVVPVAGEAATAGKIAKNADRYAAAVAKVADEVLPHLPARVQDKLRPAVEAARKKIDELGGKKPKQEPDPVPKAKDGASDGQKIKPEPRMKQKELKCFKKNKKGDPREFDRQLADQERGLNNMSVKDYLEGRQRYQDIGRQGTGTAQRQARDRYESELRRRFEDALADQGVFGEAAHRQSAQMAADRMSSLAALHSPDMIAGGKDVVSGMGDRAVNSSIGSQWKERVGELDKAAEGVPEADRDKTRMNTKLKRCGR